MSTYNYILSCDIGGTHITSAIVETKTWTILENTITRSLVHSNAEAKTILQEWTDNISNCILKHHNEIGRIGIAAPGPFDYENGVALMKGQSKYESLYQLSITQPIKNLLNKEDLTILYINDAAAFLQGEVFASGLDNHNKILGITLGTGLGSAVWEKGSKAFDADLWNTPYLENIFEEYLVTRWFTKRFKELTGISENGLREIIEKHLDLQETSQLFNEYREHLTNFLQHFSEKYNCKHFILGGNITKAWHLISPNSTFFKDYIIEIGKYQEHAAIIGAASLFSNLTES